MMSPTLEVLIPTYNRPTSLAVTLATLVGQSQHDFGVLVSDQSDEGSATASREVAAVVEVLRYQGRPVEILQHLPRRGMAEQRQFLLDQSRAPYVLYLDDDLILEPDALALMLNALQQAGCGFVGCAVAGLPYLYDERPADQAIEFWEGAVTPEQVRPGTPAWQRHRLHMAANILHVQDRLGITPDHPRLYKVAWVGACTLYDATKLRDVGGFSFWPELPAEHAGEDVLAQIRVMEKYGGAGLIPTRVYHQIVGTTVPNREVDAPYVLL